jgi:predicted AAA+ superfamily ATPase
MAEISPNNTGLSGEYFVAAELYRRGWSIGLTIGNAKAVDLFAEKNDIVVQVQVKSICWRKNSEWPMMRDEIKMNCIYIFVNLNAIPAQSETQMNQPDFLFVPEKKHLKI